MAIAKLRSKWTTGGLVFYNAADMGSGLHYLTLDIDATLITGEQHALDIDFTGACSSGDMMVAANFICTPTGTAASWCSGIYAKVVEGTTKSVNGYLCAAELELIIGAGDYNPSDCAVLVLNAQINNVNLANISHPAYVYLREYGASAMPNLFWFADQTVGTNSEAVLLSTLNADQAASHTIKFLVGTTPYWILCTTTHG